MNDSLSASSTYSSTNNSNSNSLNRSAVFGNESTLSNGSSICAASNTTATSNLSSTSSSSSSSNRSSGQHEDTMPVATVVLTSSSPAPLPLEIKRNSSLLRHSMLTGSGSVGGGVVGVDAYFCPPLPMTPVRRRSKSQIVFYGDEANTITAEHNKQLIEDLYLLKKTLKDKDDTIFRLNDVRDKLESEIRELSASLFEEAYNMVNTARAETAQFEKLLKEANGKIDVLQAEVKALKELVLTSTPSTPNKHLHPHLTYSHNNGASALHRTSHSRQSSLNQQQLNSLTMPQSSSNHTLSNGAASNVIAGSSQLTHANHPNQPASLHNLLPSSTSTPLSHNSNNNSNSNKGTTASLVAAVADCAAGASQSVHMSSSLPKEKLSFFKSSHKRVPSQSELQSSSQSGGNGKSSSLIDKLFQSSSSSLPNQQKLQHQLQMQMQQQQQQLQLEANELSSYEIYEAQFDQNYFKEIVQWKENPTLISKETPFMNRVYKEDIMPCLNFNDKKLTEELLLAIEANCVCIEDLTKSQLPIETFAQ